MAIVAEQTSLGPLEMVEVFAQHDFPVLFACKNPSDQLYLATWVSESSTATGWLYSAISSVRLGKLRDQLVPVRDVFDSPEAGHLYLISVPKRGGGSELRRVAPNELTDDMLPVRGAFVEESEVIGDLVASELLASTDDAEVVLDGDPVVNHGVRADFFGAFLRAVQELATSLGQRLDDIASGVVTGSARISEVYQLFVQPRFEKSSFKARLTISTSEDGSDQSSPHGSVLDVVSQALSGDSTYVNSPALFQDARVRSRYKALLSLVAKRGAKLTIRTRGNPYGVRLTSQQARTRIERLAKPTRKKLTLTGTIDGGSLTKDRFELSVGDASYKGRTSALAKRQLRSIALGTRVEAIVEEISRVGKQSGDVRTRYVLLEVKPVA